MRVVLLNQFYRPAEAPTAALAADLCEALVAAGHEVSVVCSSRAYNDGSQRFPTRETLDGVDVFRTWTVGTPRHRRWMRVFDYLSYLLGAAWRLLRISRPDVVIAMTTPPLLARVAFPIARWRGATTLFWVMDVYPDLAFRLGMIEERSLAGRLLRRVARRALEMSHSVIALGDDMKTELERQGANNVSVVENWCDPAKVQYQADGENALRSEWGWGTRCVFGYSGNIGLAHEFGTILDAAEALQDDDRIHFAFIGAGARLGEVQAEVQRRGLSNVEFQPWVPDAQLSDSLAAIDVHLVSLLPQMTGLLVPSKIYGILAAGRPCLYVGPADSSVASLLARHQSGLRCDVGEVERLVGYCRDYADRPELREQQGRAARDGFEHQHDRAEALTQFVARIERLVS